MNALKRQYFFSFAVIGSVMPLITVFLKEQGGLNFFQLGIASAVMGIPMLFSPAALTFLADRGTDTRRILAAAYLVSALVLSGIYFSKSITLTLILYFCHGLSFVAMLPLQDGYFFSLAEERSQNREKTIEYPMMRVWGTAGFMLPALLLFLPLHLGAPPGAILPLAVFFCLISLANSLTLPPLRRQQEKPRSDPHGTGPTVAYWRKRGVPTSLALRRLLSPEGRWLAAGMFFGLVAASSYYAFVSNYYDEVIAIPRKYFGLIFNLGVLLEIGYTLLMPRMQRWIGLKAIVLLGFVMMTARLLLLAFFPTVTMAVVTQIFHGVEVLALWLAPPVLLNRLAGEEYRNSIQGVYTMFVGGTSRVLAGVACGAVVMAFGLKPGLYFSAGSAVIACLIIGLLFERIAPPKRVDYGASQSED